MTRMNKERLFGQSGPELQVFFTVVDEHRRFRTEVPRFQCSHTGNTITVFGEKHRRGSRIQKAPKGVVLARPRVPLQQLGNQFIDAPGTLGACRFTNGPFDEGTVCSVIVIGKDGQKEQLAATHRDFMVKGN